MNDVRVDTYRDSGAGGQHRNVTDSAVRLTHMPTGIVVTASEERSQHANRKRAYKRLYEALSASQEQSLHDETNAQRIEDFSKQNEWVWCAWRDEVKHGKRKYSMKQALKGKFKNLLKE